MRQRGSRRFGSRLLPGLLAVVLGGALGACSDDPVEQRPEIEGLVIQDGGTTIVEARPDGVVEGILNVPEGEVSDFFFVLFTDGAGVPVDLEDDEFVILRDFDDQIVGVTQASPGSPSFRIEGLAAGQTGLVIELARGAVSDPDPPTLYVTPEPVPVTVTGVF